MQACGGGEEENSAAAAMSTGEVLGSRSEPVRWWVPSPSCWGFGFSRLLPAAPFSGGLSLADQSTSSER